MGGGSWTRASFDAYSCSTKGVDSVTFAASTATAQDIFKARSIDPDLNPFNVVRECVDTEEHPNTFPVILALDVTGSMGGSAAKVAKSLGEIMESLYDSKIVPDIEFCVMAIGDLYCDDAPIQISQFESDVRIAEHLDKVFFERGGGANEWESYTSAWYMGSRHCKLDCWNRGKKGVIITLGDESPNPYLQASKISKFVGDGIQADVGTRELLNEVSDKFYIYHISVDDPESSYKINKSVFGIDGKWKKLLGDNYSVCTLNSLPKKIAELIESSYTEDGTANADVSDGISW